MTGRTPSVELRAAAAKLRALGNPLLHYTPPWNTHPGDDGEWLVGYTQDNPLAGLVATTPDYGGMALPDWIAAMHPGIAEPLATWLEMTAERYEQYPIETPLIVAAVAVARVINGPAS